MELLEMAREIQDRGIDPFRLLEEALALAKTFEAVRGRDAGPDDGRRADPLSTRIYVPHIAREDTDPVALLGKCREMVAKEQRPYLALLVAEEGSDSVVAAWSSVATENAPAPTVDQLLSAAPGALFAPEIASLVVDLHALAMRPRQAFADYSIETGSGERLPVMNHTLDPLPPDQHGAVDAMAESFLALADEPSPDHFGSMAALRKAISPPPTDPDDVPIGAPLPEPPTPSELQARGEKAAEAEREFIVISRHAAIEALRRILKSSLEWRPSRELSAAVVKLVAARLTDLRPVARNRALAKAFGVSERLVRQRLQPSGNPDLRPWRPE